MKGSIFQGFSEATLQKQALVAAVVVVGLVGWGESSERVPGRSADVAGPKATSCSSMPVYRPQDDPDSPPPSLPPPPLPLPEGLGVIHPSPAP